MALLRLEGLRVKSANTKGNAFVTREEGAEEGTLKWNLEPWEEWTAPEHIVLILSPG